MTPKVAGRLTGIAGVLLIAPLAVLTCGCLPEKMSFDPHSSKAVAAGTDREASSLDTSAILARAKEAVEAQLAAKDDSAPIGPVEGQISFTTQDVARYTPDPIEVGLKDIARPRQVKLALQDCVSKAAANSFRIQTEGYGPSISAMDILRAEAAFDAVYFLEASFQKQNQPVPSELLSGDSDQRTLITGLAKPMPTGATVTGTYNLVRLDTALSFATLNPSYANNFTLELRQPLLRNFGLDYNRAPINLAKNNLRIAKHRFRQTVRDVLSDVEKTYWRLAGARRDVVIQHNLIQQTKLTRDYIIKRLGYDARAVEVTRVKALLGTREAEYVEVKNRVEDFEDQLKTLMNDPQLNLGEEIEIIPTDLPTVGPIVLDRISEIRAALENRSEVQEVKLNIDNARINVAVTKNEALPKLDLVFQYILSGLDTNPGRAFDELSTSNYQDYYVGLSFEYPIGNRAARAAMKQAILQRNQVISSLKEAIETTILEVDVAIRGLQTSYYQVKPSKEAVEAAEESLATIVARKIKLSPEFLEVQLNAQETLAQARRVLLNALVNYNVAVIELERAKDTLLNYDNVAIEPVRAD